MSTAIPFDSILVGGELGPIETEITAEAVRRYCADWDDHNPLYTAGSAEFDGPVAPPAFVAGLTCFRLLASRYDSRATLDAKSAHENLRPIRVGQTIRTVGRVCDKYVKRGFEYVVVESVSYDESGEPVRRSRDHIVLSLERAQESEAGR